MYVRVWCDIRRNRHFPEISLLMYICLTSELYIDVCTYMYTHTIGKLVDNVDDSITTLNIKLQRTATYCNRLQYTATRCNTHTPSGSLSTMWMTPLLHCKSCDTNADALFVCVYVCVCVCMCVCSCVCERENVCLPVCAIT